MKRELSVPTMVCQVCADNITKAIAAVDEKADIRIELVEKKVIVETRLTESSLTQAISDIGHEVLK